MTRYLLLIKLMFVIFWLVMMSPDVVWSVLLHCINHLVVSEIFVHVWYIVMVIFLFFFLLLLMSNLCVIDVTLDGVIALVYTHKAAFGVCFTVLIRGAAITINFHTRYVMIFIIFPKMEYICWCFYLSSLWLLGIFMVFLAILNWIFIHVNCWIIYLSVCMITFYCIAMDSFV